MRAHLVVMKVRHLSINQIIVVSLTIFLGLGLGFLISSGDWFYALALATLVPLALLFTTRPFLGLIIWLLLLPLNAALPNPELMYWAIHRFLILFTLCMFLLIRLANPFRSHRLRLGLPEICITLLAGLIPLSIYLTHPDVFEPFRKYADRFLIPMCIYLAIRITSLGDREIKLLEWTVFIVAVIQSLIGFVSWIMPSIFPRAWHRLMGIRTAGSLDDPAVFTSMLVFCAVLLIYAAMRRRNGFARTMFLVVSGVSFIGVFISLERGSWLAGGLVLLGLLVLFGKRMLKLLLVGAIVITFLVVGPLSRFVNLATQRLGEQNPIDSRLVVNDAMLQMIRVKPVWGWGYDVLDQHIRGYYRSVGSAYIIGNRLETSHNTYLTIFIELGLVGFLLFLLPVVIPFIKSLQAWRGHPKMDANHQLLLWTLWLAALQNFVVSNFMDMRFFPIGLGLWWLTLGLVANLLNQYVEDREEYNKNWSKQLQHPDLLQNEVLLEKDGNNSE